MTLELKNYDVTTLDTQQCQSVDGGIDQNGSGISWALGYSWGWCENSVTTAIDYYRYNFP